MRLLEPFTLGEQRLSSRIVMAPPPRCSESQPRIPPSLVSEHYARRASAGLIISEPARVDPRSVPVGAICAGIFEETQVEGWREVVDPIHLAGGKIFVQLTHPGRARRTWRDGGEADATPFPAPHALTLGDILQLVDHFTHAAILAREAGFDGVEICAANGNLIDQFLRSGTNLRTDAYGGTARNRVRLLLEVTEAVAAIWGVGRVGVRMSPLKRIEGMTDDDPFRTFTHAAEGLDQIGIAYFHLVEPAGHDSELAQRLRETFGGALLVAADHDRDTAEAAIAAGVADLVAFSQGLAANPDTPGYLRRRPAAGVRTRSIQTPRRQE